MSLYSYSNLSSEESSNSYSPSSSITTVSSQLSSKRQNSISDDEQQQWPAPPVQETAIQKHWRIEKNISLKDQQSLGNKCILRATMTKDHILIHNSSSTPAVIIPGKHISMKVAFKY